MAKRSANSSVGASFSTSDFSIKSASVVVGDLDVSSVSGTSDLGISTDYTAYLTTILTEVSASIDTVLYDVTASSGNTLSIVGDYPIVINTATSETVVPTEVIETITSANSGITASGTLSLVTSVSTVKPTTLVIDVSSGSYTFVDNGSGILTDSVSGIGAIDYTTGAWEITSSEILTEGVILSADYTVQYLWETVTTPITIRHTVDDDAIEDGTISGYLSALIVDPVASATKTSAMFTLSTDYTPSSNPWFGKGALPGESELETRGRFLSEGII